MNGPDTSPVRWRLFLRALAEEADQVLDGEGRDALLRGVGRRMARLAPLPAVSRLEDLETEANEVLAEIGWGRVRFAMDEASRVLRITHALLPTVGSAHGPRGPWLSAVLEGLYTTWFGQQPDAVHGLTAWRLASEADGTVVLNYSRAELKGEDR